jgi:hypothetical protein
MHDTSAGRPLCAGDFDMFIPVARPSAGNRANANERECGEQGTQVAARLAGTPRLVLLSMAGLRAAG